MRKMLTLQPGYQFFAFFFFFKQKILCNEKGVALLYGQGGWDRKQFSVGGKVRARHENMLISQCDMRMGVQKDVSGMKRKTSW